MPSADTERFWICGVTRGVEPRVASPGRARVAIRRDERRRACASKLARSFLRRPRVRRGRAGKTSARVPKRKPESNSSHVVRQVGIQLVNLGRKRLLLCVEQFNQKRNARAKPPLFQLEIIGRGGGKRVGANGCGVCRAHVEGEPRRAS